MAPFSLAGRTALVTGAAGWTGQGIARALAHHGAAVVVNDIDRERADALVAELAAAGASVYGAPFDVTDYDAVSAGVRESEAALAPVDILVNCVGMPGTPNKHIEFAHSDPADWRPWIDINIYGSLNCLRAVLAGMCARGWGRVIQISSAMAARGLPNRESLLGGSKAGIEGTLRSIALEVVDRGVTINTLAVGLLQNATVHARPEIVRATLARVPAGRFIEPSEVGAAVVYLASEEAAMITGQTHHLNGGSYQGH
jgi:NAD(P)-dependent dehydrogenase (short-subunit alcohol dehydrogenase family)